MFQSQHQLYLQTKLLNDSWLTPILLASGVDTAYLLSNSQGQIVVVWQPINELETVLVSEISITTSGAINVTPASSSTILTSRLIGTPVFNKQGTLAMLRNLSSTDADSYVVTQYQISSGWNLSPEISLNASGFDTSNIQLALTSDNQLIAFAQSIALRSLHSAFLLPNGSWTPWIQVQSNFETPTALVGQYKVATSDIGHLYVMWVEERINANSPDYLVMFSNFNASKLTSGFP